MNPVRDRGHNEGTENSDGNSRNFTGNLSQNSNEARLVSNGVNDLGDAKQSESPENRTETPPPIVEDKKKSNGLFGYTVLALGIALFIRFFIATPYVVSGASMEPTFHDWQYLIVDKLIYTIHLPERGDVVVFKLPGDEDRSLIKRVIGLPTETVRIRGSKITIRNDANPDGFTLPEEYVDERNASRGDSLEVTLGEQEYFVLGDNRIVSADSRLWGTLPQENVTGRVDARLFPLNAIGILPGKATFDR